MTAADRIAAIELPEPVAIIFRGGTPVFGYGTILQAWLPESDVIPLGEHMVFTAASVLALLAAAAAIAREAEPSESPLGPGWTTISVNAGFAALMSALERADRKGYMPDAMADEWSAFDYRDSTATAVVQACRPEDRAMLATPAGAELVACVVAALNAEPAASAEDERAAFEAAFPDARAYTAQGLITPYFAPYALAWTTWQAARASRAAASRDVQRDAALFALIPPTRKLGSGTINRKYIELRGWYEEDLAPLLAALAAAQAGKDPT